MIPKIIHYVWVGGGEISPEALTYIEGWRKLCPDYEIKEWNDDAVSKIPNKYMEQAYERKAWAFVSDYLRLYALFNYGGFYFDTDWEMTRSIDEFRQYKFVTGFERWESGYDYWTGIYAPIVSAMMGAEKGNDLIAELLGEYEELSFINERGEPELLPNTNRITLYFFKKYGLEAPFDGTKTLELEPQHLVFPFSHFCLPDENKINFGIHHFHASWYSRPSILQRLLKRIRRCNFCKRKNKTN